MFLAVFLLLLAALLFYLCHPNQQLLMQPADHLMLYAGWGCSALAVMLLATAFSTGTTVLITLAALMLWLGLVPFLSLLLAKPQSGAPDDQTH